MTDAQRFLETFLSNTASHYRGTPTDTWVNTPHGPKNKFKYTCIDRAYDLRDVENHLAGNYQIVANPLRDDGTVAWANLDNDRYDQLKNFVPPKDLPLNFSPSKSGGQYAIAMFEVPTHAYFAQRIMERFARILGWWPCEINPKQCRLTAETPKGNGVALPYFGMHTMSQIVRYRPTNKEMFFNPDDYAEKLTDVARANSTEALVLGTAEDSGYWSTDALLAMLTFYKENFPGFDFRKSRRGYAVPCPGNPKLGGWSDGARHSTKDALISHEALVFIRNGWPKFRCVHAHCEQPKKTINHWREYWDPLRLWEFDEWLDAEMERLNHVG
jgi:hypothetical protein